MDFVCKSLKTAIEALSSWYHIDEEDFDEVLREDFYRTYVCSGASREEQFSNYLIKQLPFKAGNTELLPRVHWFHGTRCSNLNEYDKGLLPLKSIISMIQKKVDDIAYKHRIPRSKKPTDIGNFSAVLIDKKLSTKQVERQCSATILCDFDVCYGHTNPK